MLQKILDSTENNIIFFGKDFKVLAVNKIAQKRFKVINGKTLEIGEDIRPFVDRSNEKNFFEGYTKALEGKSFEFEQEIRTNKGTVWLFHKLSPLYDNQKNFLGILCEVSNIEEKKHLEHKYLEFESRFKSVFETAPLAMLIVNEQMNIQELNKEASVLFGYEKDELLNANINMLIPKRYNPKHEGLQKNYIQDPIPIRMGMERNTPALLKNGEEIIVDISLNGFTIGGKKYVTAIIQDITKRIDDEKKILTQLKQLKEIAWTQSHEVRKPLANILGLVRMLKHEEENKEQLLDLLEKSANDLDDIIRRIVKNAHLENPEQNL